MNQQVLDKSTIDDATVHGSTTTVTEVTAPIEHHDVAGILAQMTFRERIRAYEKGVFTRRELNAAAAREPDRMPHLNGEFEHIAAFLADFD